MVEFLHSKVKGDTGRLAATYLAIIMILTIGFSSVIYSISSSQLNRPFPPHGINGGNAYRFDVDTQTGLRRLFEERAEDARAELLLSLVFLNIIVLTGGAFFSYFLARKTLQPIEVAMQAQAQFVSDASHELRTPLTALQVTNEVALRKKKLSIGEAKDLIKHNLAETVKLRSLSEALLGLAKQENADVSRQQIQLVDSINSAIDSLAPLARDKKIAIKNNAQAGMVTANQSAIEQILRILIDNAIKYSPADSVVTVSSAANASSTTITVADQGPGIAPEHQARIFDRFYRVDESRSSQNVQGSGLGLAIAKSIATRQGYQLSVESQAGSGTTFTVILP